MKIVENGHDPSGDSAPSRAGQLAIVSDDGLQTRIVGKCPRPFAISFLSGVTV